MSIATIDSAYHLSVTVVQDDSPVGFRVLDMRRDHSPLITELAWRAVAAEPSAAGKRWVPTVRMDDCESPRVILEACLADGDGKPARAETLAFLEVPASAFHWIAAEIAAAVGTVGQCDYLIAVQEPSSMVVANWNTGDGDEDFEFLEQDQPRLTLPGDFSVAKLSDAKRVIDQDDTWLRCVFHRRSFEMFLSAASNETEKERSWLGLGHVCLTHDACSVVIEPELVELPGETGRGWITTRGRDWARLHHQLGDRLVAFLHLHPQTLDGEPLSPRPSRNDAVVAWNFSLASRAPVVFPIAMFGAHAGSPNGDVAGYGYEGGLLRRIQLEVLS